MKVLLLAPKNSPTYLNSLHAALRIQVGTCDLYALDDKQSANLEEFFRYFIKLQHYDRIVLMYGGDYIYQQGRFLRTLPSLSMLRLEYDPPEARKKMKSNFHAMPWLRWIGSDIAVAKEYGDLGHDVFWLPQVYDPEHFFARPKNSAIPTCHLYDGNGGNTKSLRLMLSERPVSYSPLDKATLWQSMSSGIVGREDLFIFLPETDHYDPTPMLWAMACGATVITPDPGNEIRLLYRWRDMHDAIFYSDAQDIPVIIDKILAHPHRHASISQHAIERAKNFQPQTIGKRVGEYLETRVRDPANYPKRQRIFGFEI